jgi:hypothetical protein
VTLRLAEPRTQNPGDIVPVCFTAPVSENHVPSLHLPDDRRDDFPDGEIDVHGKDLPILDEFDFPADLLGGPVPNPLLLDAPPAIDPYGSDFAGPLNSDVLMLLDEMSPPEREARLAELRAMDAEALKRANIAARNYQMLSGLGLGNAQKETLWAGAVAPPATKRKAATDGRQTKGKRTRKRKDPVEEVSEAEEEEDSDDAPDEPPVEKPKKPVPEAKQVQKGPSGREGATPKWAETAQRFLTSTELGSEWAALLVLWYGREKRAGFEGTVSTAFSPLPLTSCDNADTSSISDEITSSKAAAQGGQRLGVESKKSYAHHRRCRCIWKRLVGVVDRYQSRLAWIRTAIVAGRRFMGTDGFVRDKRVLERANGTEMVARRYARSIARLGRGSCRGHVGASGNGKVRSFFHWH